MRRPGLPILVLALIGVVAAFLRDPGDLIVPPFVSHAERGLPQSYVVNARSLTFDLKGVLTDIMEASSVEQFEQLDESLLENPRFYSHNGNDKTWSASADRGHFRPSTETLTLNDNVVLTHDDSGGRLETQEMTIEIPQKVATSDVPVLITQGTSRSRSDGMHADLERELIRMQPNVETIYVEPR